MTPPSWRRAPIAAPLPETPSPIRLGPGANWRQFTLLVVVNAFVGAMVGLERTVVPLIARADFGLVSKTVVLSFLVSFGIVKALANLFAAPAQSRTWNRFGDVTRFQKSTKPLDAVTPSKRPGCSAVIRQLIVSVPALPSSYSTRRIASPAVLPGMLGTDASARSHRTSPVIR